MLEAPAAFHELTASQSRSSGWDGLDPFRPKSKTVVTSGRPKCRAQTWFTITRAESGFCRSAIQFASADRRPVLVVGNGLNREASVSRFDSFVLREPRGTVYESPGFSAAFVAAATAALAASRFFSRPARSPVTARKKRVRPGQRFLGNATAAFGPGRRFGQVGYVAPSGPRSPIRPLGRDRASSDAASAVAAFRALSAGRSRPRPASRHAVDSGSGLA